MSRPRRVAVVVAHPDDESFGTGSTLLHAAARGAHTSVVCATRGEAGGDGEVREGELHAAARLLGVGEVRLLGFADSGMSGDAGPDTLCGASDAAVDAAVGVALDELRPDVVVTLDGADGHRDHARIRDAVLRTLAGTDVPVYLQCLPRSLMHAWARHQAGNPDAAAYVDLPDLGTRDDELTTVIDTAAHLAARDRAIAAHASQTSPYDGLPDDLRRAFLGREHLKRVQPPWDGGPLETDLLGVG